MTTPTLPLSKHTMRVASKGSLIRSHKTLTMFKGVVALLQTYEKKFADAEFSFLFIFITPWFGM